MSPLLSLIANLYNQDKTTISILWYTHPKPKELVKKIILYTSLLMNDKVVTASESSFPYFSKKNKRNWPCYRLQFILKPKK